MAALAIAGAEPKVRSTPPNLETALGVSPRVNKGLPAEVCRCVNGPLAFAPQGKHCVRCGRDEAPSELARLVASARDGLLLLDGAIESERIRLRLQAEALGQEWTDVLHEYRELTEGGWK